MINQTERLQNFKVNANQVEIEANFRLHSEAIQMLKKGFCEKFVANKCFLSLKEVKILKKKLIEAN